MIADDDLRRNRLLVFFRLPLFAPHLVWAILWGIAAVVVAIIDWFATLFGGTSPVWAHSFLARYVRYWVHILAFLLVAANPFPGFAGKPAVIRSTSSVYDTRVAYVTLLADPFPAFTGRSGSYPIELSVPAPGKQNRWLIAFRIVLAIPAVVLATSSEFVLWTVGWIGWFAALFTARMPIGLRNLGLYCLQYIQQTCAPGGRAPAPRAWLAPP